ncbi:MAG: peptidase [Caldithrix sp.]|nr:peptidase [Caldithrix sp.]
MHKMFLKLIILLIATSNLLVAQNEDDNMRVMQEKLAQFAETEITYDASLLDDRQKVVVKKLYRAAKIMDELFLQQVYHKNMNIRQALQKSDRPVDRLKLQYFNIMFGPFDRLNHNKPFYGDQPKPPGANYYPPDMTKDEFQHWLQDHPEDREAFTSEFTVIRRRGDQLVAIPYSQYYKEPLERAANLLKEAADYADNPSLQKYLRTRAEAFGTNDYFESDMAWMDLKDHTIEVVIGPYEVYEDQLFNYKAAFECFLTIKDPQESQKLAVFGDYLNDMEKNLPIPDEHKNFNRGSESPIMVVQEIFSAGDTKAGVQTLAFNLPNDERVRQQKGSKKVMLKNMHEAKFKKQLKPIAERILDEDLLADVTFEGFFNHTLMHEMSHGIGPGIITVDGRQTEVKDELKETYSKIEECKADVLGMYNNIFMIEKGQYPKAFENEIWATFLAGIFRSIRFGINEAHGAGNAIIYNYLLQNNAYRFDAETQRLSVNFDTIYIVLKQLAHKVLMIQATGDYQGAKQLIEEYAVDSPSINRLRDKIADIPVDIKPVFHIEQTMMSE